MALEMIVSEGGSKLAPMVAAVWVALAVGVEFVMSKARMACATVVPEVASLTDSECLQETLPLDGEGGKLMFWAETKEPSDVRLSTVWQ